MANLFVIKNRQKNFWQIRDNFNSVLCALVLHNSCDIQFYSKFDDYTGYHNIKRLGNPSHSSDELSLAKPDHFCLFLFVVPEKQHKMIKEVWLCKALLLKNLCRFKTYFLSFTWIDFMTCEVHSVRSHDY